MEEKKEDITPEEKEFVSQFKGRPPQAVADRVRAVAAKHRLFLKKPNKYGQIKVNVTKPLDIWLAEFLKNGGNATQAAYAVNPNYTKISAATMGGKFLKIARDSARLIMEENGATYGDLLKLLIDKAKESKSPEFIDRLMKIGGYEDFMAKNNGNQIGVVNIIDAQKKLLNKYGADEVVEGEMEEDVEV